MPRALTASTAGTCARCGLPYSTGQRVTYSLTKPGERYHFPSCAEANTTAKPSTEPVFTRVPTPTPTEIASLPESLAKRHAPKAIGKIKPNSKWWDVLEACLESGLTRILLVGPPGTGKSTTADRDGLRVTCHEDAGPESMVGTFIQKDGNTVWIDGPAVCAMKRGSRIVLDETDHSSPECVSLLYALLDDSPSIVLPTGEQVKATGGYQVIGTSNSSPADFPEAILDRFEAVIIADEPHPLAVDRVKDDAGERSASLVSLMTNYYRGINKSGYQFRGNPTLRKCRNFARLLVAGLHEDVAAKVVFGNAGKEVQSALTTAGVKT